MPFIHTSNLNNPVKLRGACGVVLVVLMVLRGVEGRGCSGRPRDGRFGQFSGWILGEIDRSKKAKKAG